METFWLSTPANQINKVRNTKNMTRKNIRLNSCGCINGITESPNEGGVCPSDEEIFGENGSSYNAN